MDLPIVPVSDSDLPAAFEPILLAFGRHRLDEAQLADAMLTAADEAMVGVIDGERWVGTLATVPFELTLPGGAPLPVPGITAAAVSPTHRRRGILTALMDRVLDDASDQGMAATVLLAQEAPIYGRHGFGVATRFVSTQLDAAAIRFGEPVADPGRFVMPDAVEASGLAERAWARHLAWRPGTMSRRTWAWELLRRDRPDRRHGGGPLGWVVHLDGDDEPDGYAAYWVTGGEDAGRARSVARVHDLVGVDAEVEALLVQFLARLDLVHRLEFVLRPLDDPLRWRLVDQRELVVQELGDYLWLRVLDVAAAFAGRTYGCRDRLVLEVDDPRRSAAGGRFVFGGGPDGGSCSRTAEEPDLRLGIAELGSLLLGTIDPSELAAAGRVSAPPSVLARADAFFRSTPRPFCATRF